ncbi:MAG: Grx4 family monothiol glutaredoxin [Parvibaculum sp.]
MSEPVFERIGGILSNADVVLFMKGTSAAPKCGFSASVAQVLGILGVPYQSVDVLADLEIRDGIKAFSNWPTIPQLYIKGEFIGGADIVGEMYRLGELPTLLADKGVAITAA